VKNVAEQAQTKCPHCGSTSIWKRGMQILSKGIVQRYQCKSCGYLFTGKQLMFKLPNPIEVRGDFFRTVKKLDSFVTFVSTHESMKFKEFQNHFHSIRMDVLRIWHQTNLLTITDKKYSKAFEKLRKILIKLVDLSVVEKKHLKHGILSWEYEFQKGKLRKDLIKFLKDASKQIKKVQKYI